MRKRSAIFADGEAQRLGIASYERPSMPTRGISLIYRLLSITRATTKSIRRTPLIRVARAIYLKAMTDSAGIVRLNYCFMATTTESWTQRTTFMNSYIKASWRLYSIGDTTPTFYCAEYDIDRGDSDRYRWLHMKRENLA